MKGIPASLPGLFERNDLYIKKEMKTSPTLPDLFGKRWIQEYLLLLGATKLGIMYRDIVLVHNSGLSQTSTWWPVIIASAGKGQWKGEDVIN